MVIWPKSGSSGPTLSQPPVKRRVAMKGFWRQHGRATSSFFVLVGHLHIVPGQWWRNPSVVAASTRPGGNVFVLLPWPSRSRRGRVLQELEHFH